MGAIGRLDILLIRSIIKDQDHQMSTILQGSVFAAYSCDRASSAGLPQFSDSSDSNLFVLSWDEIHVSHEQTRVLLRP